MQYRIELSSTRKGVARVHLPGRELELAATGEVGALWQIAVSDVPTAPSGIVELRAATANDAVWRAARAAVRAISELTGSPLDGGLSPAGD